MDAGKPVFSPRASSGSRNADGFAIFRLLLPHSFSDADTMDLYAAVNPLRRRTPSLQVRVEPLDSSASDSDAIRVAVVLGPTAPVRSVEASSSNCAPLALSPLQEALVAVLDAEGALHRADKVGRGAPGNVTCLLLVEAARLEAAAGRGVLGRIALETGAGMRVVPWEMNAPSSRGKGSEEVIEITGELMNVREALCLVSWKLQNHVFSSKVNNYKNGSFPTSNIAESNATSQVNSSPGYGMESVAKSSSDYQITSSKVQKAQNNNGIGFNNSDNGKLSDNGINKSNNGIASIRENNLMRGVKPARITRITYETVISREILHLVNGDSGNNLIQLKEITGANVSVYCAPSEGNETTIVVSGPPDSAQSAQRLLVDFILQGQS